ncbi:putative GTPase activating protein for Arf-domain-containing protein [Dactylonectria macrodidyma]|uniref:GTPase activating protein for Arf-domain-containing protein n=1 Tax=Dactylonectria macrodidyma TaxID=307937 RepID=A0A9P9FG37_9HYPO|nr:putative GTPase activating protein for Arf-domain-containing protein [Dactylonectria macrodidyma]
MSRRAPNPAAERAAQNTATIKNLLKLESNKVCADCKRNKHPRWASWNLGVFICIRCSGIHRGMGTHISRVKSVDLDSWTDEQMQSILSWGNARANKYWEAKLAAGHAPSEGKIENFIRTKYELKRWTMEGPIPDPSTLDADGDDDVPLSLVKEKQVIERKESIRKASLGQSSAPSGAPRSLPPPQGDLIGGDPVPVRSSSAAPPVAKVAPKGDPAPPRSTSTKDSLLGLDFFGEPSAPPRPASTTGTNPASGQSRPDLKQSILSLYATAPRPQAPPQQPAQGGFGGIPSPTFAHQSQGSIGGFGDAFGNLSISNNAPPKPAAPDPFANLGSGRVTSSNSAFGGLGGGSFFDSKPAQPAAPTHQKQPSFGGGFGGFSSPTPAAAPAKPAQTSSAMGDLFDLSAPVSQTSPPLPSKPVMSPTSNSVFNLSSPQPAAPAPVTTTTTTSSMGGFSSSDVWGGGNEWSTPAAAGPAPVAAQKSPAIPMSASNDFGWGSPAAAVPSSSFANTPIVPGASGGFSPQPPKVSADEEFGGWTSSTGPSNSGATKKSGGGFGGDEDLFSNVWG